MLNLYKLEIFGYVAQVGSFSKAAEHFLMSQSGISQHMQDLEASLGTPLFNRGPRGVTLTTTGDKLLRYAHDIFKLVTEAELLLTDVSHLKNGTVTIGTTPGVGVYMLPDWIQAFREHFPNLTVSLKTDTTPNIARELAIRQMDMGFIEGELETRQAETLNVFELSPVPQHIVVGAKHAWWNQDQVPASALDGQTMVTRQQRSQTRIWLDQVLQQRHIKPKVMGEFDSIESIKRAVMAGTCFTILPAYTVREECDKGQLRMIHFSDDALVRALKLVWNKDLHLSAVACAFLSEVKKVFPALDPLLTPFCQAQTAFVAD